MMESFPGIGPEERGKEQQEKEAGRPVTVVREQQELAQAASAMIVVTDVQGGRAPLTFRDNQNVNLPPGNYRLVARVERVQENQNVFLQEAVYQVLDARGGVVQEFPATHVPINNVRIDAGQQLRVLLLRPIRRWEQPQVEAVRAGGTPRPVLLTESQEQGIHFGVQVSIRDQQNVTRTLDAQNRELLLGPGSYSLETVHETRGFPQGALYQVLDERGAVIRTHGPAYGPVPNVTLQPGQELRVVALRSVRPYNSNVYRLGGTDVGNIFTRPYPAQDFEPGAFNGREQFSSAQIAIAFWGMWHFRDPAFREEVARLRREGIPGLRRGTPVTDQLIMATLGARVVARDLADVFVQRRQENLPDFRGQHHTTFFLRRPNGQIPPELLTMPRQQLVEEFTGRLVSMIHHNVHRETEGGGYAGRTFEQVFVEAQQRVMQWPQVSQESTNLLSSQVELLEAALRGRTPQARVRLLDFPEAARPALQVQLGGFLDNQQTFVIGRALNQQMHRLLSALLREQMNDRSYSPQMLQEAGIASDVLASRQRKLRALEDRVCVRLQQLSETP